MKARIVKFNLAAFALLLLACAAIAQTPVADSSLPNFHQVNQQLFRGAQPRPGGLQRLKALGIKTIVNLRGQGENTRAEEQEARSLELRFFQVPLPEFSAPHDVDVERVLAIIDAPENQPVFVHCRRGADRTGTIIACYRITHDNWTAEQAKKEAKGHGLSWIQRSMRGYIDQFYRKKRKGSAPAGRAPAMSSSYANPR